MFVGILWASVLGCHFYFLYGLPNQSYYSCGRNYPAFPGFCSPQKPSHNHPLLPFGFPDTLAHSQLLECAMHFSTSGPLHKIFLLPGTLFLLSLWPLFCFQLIPTHNSDFNPLKYFLQDADHRSPELGQDPVLTSFIRHLSTVVKRGSAVTFLWFTFWLCHLLAVWFGAKYLTILLHSSFHIILFISYHTTPLALELLWE